MAISNSLFVVIATLVMILGDAVSLQAANVARFGSGGGHLASREGKAEWHGLRLGDSLPEKTRLRSSPAGPVRIELPSGTLFLAGDTDVDLDITAHRIVIERGRILLQLADSEEAWTVDTGAMSFSCLSKSEAEISFAETIGVNVLMGEVQVGGLNGVASSNLKAPLEWIASEQGTSTSSVPTAEDWATRIRKRTQPRDAQGIGQLVAKDPQSKPMRLEVARYHVNVTLQAPVALVQIDQSFFNPYGQQSEGTFVFNLPEGASVSRFAMFVTPESLIEGELIERHQADQIYTSIVNKKRDPAILEQIGTNLFRMRVFPIFAHDTKRILLDYTVPLVADQGRYHFELPLMSDLKPIWDFGIRGVINPPFKAGSVTSQSHPDLKFVTEKTGEISFSQKSQDVKPPPNLVVDFQAAEENQPTIRNHETPNANHFVITMPASANPAPNKSPDPIDLLVLVDTSGSSLNLTKSRLVAKTVVNNLRPEDRWQMGRVDYEYRGLTSEWQSPRSKESRAILKQLDEEFAMGKSELDASLIAALPIFSKSPENRRRVIIYIGDGDASMLWDDSCWQNEAFRADNPNRVEFHAVKTTDERSLGKWLRDGIKLSKGRLFRLLDQVDALRDLYEWTLVGMPQATPVESCEIENIAAEDLFYDSVWPVGRELHIYGRSWARKTLELKLKLSNSPEQVHHITLEKREPEDDVFAGRLWAQKKLDLLVHTTSKVNAPGVAAIVKLSQEWTLMSPYTAFLVLETEEDYKRWNITRSLRHRYWKPSRVEDAERVHEHLRQLAEKRWNSVPPKSRILTVTDEQRDHVEDHLRAARNALAEKNPTVAIEQLIQVRVPATLMNSKAFKSLLADAYRDLGRENILHDLNLWQKLVDRRALNPIPEITPKVLGFAPGSVDIEVLQRHSQNLARLKALPEFETTKMTLEDFIRAIQASTDIPILINRKALSDEGISLEQEIDTSDIQGHLVGTAMNLVLEPLLLTLIPEKHFWRITTATDADEDLFSQIYPVKDLLSPGLLPQPNQLSNPMIDIEADELRSNRQRLKRPISVNFKKTSINDAITNISDQIGGPKIWIDKKALSDEGISSDEPISMVLDKLPAEHVLEEILSPLLLEHVFHDGVLRVTTRAAADEILETRIYSALGIVDESLIATDGWIKQEFGNLGAVPPLPMGAMGGMGGGMGGMGGGGFFGGGMMGGAGNANPNNAGDTDSNGTISAPQLDDDLESEEVKTAEVQPIHAYTRPIGSPPAIDQIGAQIIRFVTPGVWESDSYDTGRGPSICFHPLTFCYLIRQTPRVHNKLDELFNALRRQTSVARTATTFRSRENGRQKDVISNYMSLIKAIQQTTPGRWEQWDYDQYRGLLPHPPTKSLVIKNNERAHNEVARLLTQLRRALCAAESMSRQSSLEGIDDQIRFFDRPTLTDLPRNNLDSKPDDLKFTDKLRLLAVRKVPATMNQRWRSISSTTGQQLEVTILKQQDRLEVKLPDRKMRAEGPRAAVAYPGMTLVEIDAWGDAVRQLSDVLLPWMPHRSNEELARLFDISVESEDATFTTLCLTIPERADVHLKLGFSKSTGALINWQSVVDDKVQYELKFDEKTIVANDQAGKELERWELVVNSTPLSLPALDQDWREYVIVDHTKSDVPLTKARELIRRGDNAAATTLLSEMLKKQPKQPLLNFLFALSIGVNGEFDGSLAGQQRRALERVVDTGYGDLLRLVTPSSFPTIGVSQMRQILLTVPVDRRTSDLWERLSELAIDQNRFDLALSELDRAIALTTDQALQTRRQIKRVELLLKNSRPNTAEETAKKLVEHGVSWTQLLDLGDIFARAGIPAVSNDIFEKASETKDLPPQDQSELAYRRALWQKKGELRWRLLIKADDNHNREHHYFLSEVLSEADDSEDAVTLGKLASELQPDYVQTQLLLRQADLTENKTQAAEIVSMLIAEKRLPDSKIEWGISILNLGGRGNEVVEIIERRVKKAGKVKLDWIMPLADAYKSIGRESDYRRAISELGELGIIQRRLAK